VQPIEPAHIAASLRRYAGKQVYLHFEHSRGGFIRNLRAAVIEALMRGEGPYRVALRCQDDGWVIMEELTHMAVERDGTLCLYALDSDQKLSRALQISLEPFTP
jgi:hypothetical protein